LSEVLSPGEIGCTTGGHVEVANRGSVRPEPPDARIDREEITATARLIGPYVRRTPAITVAGTDFGVAAGAVTLKLELLQHTGSFKPRGAFSSMVRRTVPAAGVVAASGGNHGAAVAYAAMKLGVPAAIFVPRIASP
jgi:threonine dehydratase